MQNNRQTYSFLTMMIANHNQPYSCQTGSAVIVTQLVNVLGVDTTVLSTCLGVGKYKTV